MYAIPALGLLIWIWGWFAFRRPLASDTTSSPFSTLLHRLRRRQGLIVQLILVFACGGGLVLSLLFDPASDNHRFQAALGILLALMLAGLWAAPRQV